jgi:uncharacterized protein YegJ (DUF2314 family)
MRLIQLEMKDINKEETEWELKHNIINVCKCCAEKKHKEWQNSNKNLILNPGDYVKIPVNDNEDIEHLWFQIIEVKNNNLIIGICANQPVVVNCIKIGMTHKFKFEDIEDYKNKNGG